MTTTLSETQRGKFYFKRAFITTFAILTAVSAFIAAWMLIWGLTLGGLWGLGNSMEDEATAEPTSEFTGSEPSSSATCGTFEDEEC